MSIDINGKDADMANWQYGMFQAEYGRAMHVLLYKREQIPWRFMQRLWQAAERLASLGAFARDADAVSEPQELDLYAKYHEDSMPHERKGWMGLEEVGFKRIAVTDDRAHPIRLQSSESKSSLFGYVAESPSALADDIAAWSEGRDLAPKGLSGPVIMENIPIRLAQLERILADLRRDVLDPEVRQEYADYFEEEMEEGDKPSPVFVDPVCLADAALHANYQGSKEEESINFLIEIGHGDRLQEIYQPDLGWHLLDSTLGAVDFYVTSLPQRRWASLTSKKPEPEMVPVRSPSSQEYFSRMAALAVTRCLSTLDLIHTEDLVGTPDDSLRSRLLHIKARIILGGECNQGWHDPAYEGQYHLVTGLLEEARLWPDESRDRRHLLRLDIDLLVAKIYAAKGEFDKNEARRRQGEDESNLNPIVPPSSKNQIFTREFKRLQAEAAELGEIELGHAVELNRIQCLYGGEERERLLKLFLDRRKEGVKTRTLGEAIRVAEMSNWTKSMCEYLLAFNSDCPQPMGSRIRVMYEMRRFDMMRSHGLWSSITTVDAGRSDRHPLHAREIICEIFDDWAGDDEEEGDSAIYWGVHDFIDDLSADYYRFIARWLPDNNLRTSPILEQGWFERLVGDIDNSREDLIRIVESTGRRFKRSETYWADPRDRSRIDKSRLEISRMAGIALLFGSKENLRLDVRGFGDLHLEEGVGYWPEETMPPTVEPWDMVLANLLGGHKAYFQQADWKEDIEENIAQLARNDLHRILKYLAMPDIVLDEAVDECRGRIESYVPGKVFYTGVGSNLSNYHTPEEFLQIMDEWFGVSSSDKDGNEREHFKLEQWVEWASASLTGKETIPDRELMGYLRGLVKLRHTAFWATSDAIPNKVTNLNGILYLIEALAGMQLNHRVVAPGDTRLDFEIREVAESLHSLEPETREEHYQFALALDWMDSISQALQEAGRTISREDFKHRWPHLEEEDPFEANFLRYMDLKSRLKRHLVLHKVGYSKMYKKDLQDLLRRRGLNPEGRKSILVGRLMADDGTLLGAAKPKTDYAKMYKAELQELLSELGLSTSGKKAELVARIMASDPELMESGTSIFGIDTQYIHPAILYSRSSNIEWVLQHLAEYIEEVESGEQIFLSIIALAKLEDTPESELSYRLSEEIRNRRKAPWLSDINEEE